MKKSRLSELEAKTQRLEAKAQVRQEQRLQRILDGDIIELVKDQSTFPEYAMDPLLPFDFKLWRFTPENGINPDEYSNTDSITSLQESLKKMPPDWKYRNKKVTYKLNSNGFRTYEWKDVNWKDAIVLIGCSNTFGVGVSDDETIAYELEQLTGRQVVNLGIPSASNELLLHTAALLLERFDRPHAIAVNWTACDRFRYFEFEGYWQIGLWNAFNVTGKREETLLKLYQYRNTDIYNENMLTYYTAKSFKQLCKDRVPLVEFSYFPAAARFARSTYFKFTCDARDLIHPGHLDHCRVAEYIHKKLLDK